MEAGEKPVVYALKKDGSLLKCGNDQLIYRTSATGDYTAMTNAYTFTAGTIYLNINSGATPLAGALADDDIVVIS